VARQTVEQRLAALEAEVARLKECVEKNRVQDTDWLDDIWGAFADDPAYEEAMRLGREWRESFRPKSRVRGKR
jgi:hypothetical protein